MTLAGFDATPLEEIPAGEPEPAREPPRAEGPIADAVKPTPLQLEQIRTLVRTLEGIDPETDWGARCREIAGVPAKLLTRGGAQPLIDRLRAELAELND